MEIAVKLIVDIIVCIMFWFSGLVFGLGIGIDIGKKRKGKSEKRLICNRCGVYIIYHNHPDHLSKCPMDQGFHWSNKPL